MQELIEELKELQETQDPYTINDAIEFAESMLEKEKEVIVNAWMDDRFPLDKKKYGEEYYNITFNTKER